MLSFETEAPLLGCGIDADHIARFAKWIHEANKPSPLIFSPREIEHCLALDYPPIGLCASFCCKEAVYKALKGPYDFTSCELLWLPAQEQFHFRLSDELCHDHRISDNTAHVEITDTGECVVAVYLLGKNNKNK